jgi:CubicO group peptidase (beta-lactamase class C family)
MHSRIFFVRFLVLGWVLVASTSASEPFQTIRDEIQQTLKKESIPSIAVAVAKDGKILWEEGFGLANREQKIAATAETPYSIASITKPITATALMVLVEQGKVKLDRPANEYLGDARLVAHRGDVK